MSVCGDVFSVPAGNIPQLDPICDVRAALAILAGHSNPSQHHWLERYDEFLLGLLGAAGEWKMLVYFKIICFIMYSVTV